MRLGAVVFIAGAATLSVEICASRLLAPFFGNSTVVWANVIGLILVYLSIGYWFGGKLADRRPERALLGRIVLVAAAAIAVIPFVARPVLDATVRELDTASLGAAVGSFFAALALWPLRHWCLSPSQTHLWLHCDQLLKAPHSRSQRACRQTAPASASSETS